MQGTNRVFKVTYKVIYERGTNQFNKSVLACDAEEAIGKVKVRVMKDKDYKGFDPLEVELVLELDVL